MFESKLEADGQAEEVMIPGAGQACYRRDRKDTQSYALSLSTRPNTGQPPCVICLPLCEYRSSINVHGRGMRLK